MADAAAVRLALDAPLDLDATLYSGQAFRWRHDEDGHTGFVANEPVRVRIEDGLLHVEGAASRPALRCYFRLDGTHAAFLTGVRRDRWLAQALDRFDGLRLLRQDPWEALVAFLLSQNANEAKIRRNVEALAATAGEAVSFRDRTMHRFPDPEALAALDEATLRRLGLGYRAPYVAHAARAVADGRLDLASLETEPYPTALETLTSLPGVGPKVADCVILYGLGRLEAFPADVWIRRLVDRHYYRGPNKTAPYAWIRAFGRRRFGANAGYAQHVLFHWVRRGGASPRMDATTRK